MTVLCLRGSESLGLQKNKVYPVLDVYQMGKDFGFNVRIVLQLSGRRITVYVPMVHKKRLGEPTGFNVNGGDVMRKARLAFQGKIEARNF